MRTVHPLRTATLLAILVTAVLPFASAQIDDRARALLEGLQGVDTGPVDTLDQVMVKTFDVAGESQTVRSRTIIDFVGERAAIDMELAPGMSTTIVIVDGQARMRMAGMMMPLPGMMADTFDGIFTRDAFDMLGEGATATYDGVHAYGGLVEGQQVTFSGPTNFAGVDDASESRMLFDPQGRLMAMVADSEEGEMLILYDEPFTGSAVVGRGATIYRLLPSGPERFATMMFEEVRINEPIADGTFD